MPHLSGLDFLRAIRAGATRATGFVSKPFFNPSLTEQVLNLVALMPSLPSYAVEDFQEYDELEVRA